MERREVKSAAQLDREFARTHYALAEHDFAMAKEAWNKKLTYTTGENLSATVFNLESGYGWANSRWARPGSAQRQTPVRWRTS